MPDMELNPLILGAVTMEDGRPRRAPSSVMERWTADTIQAARVPAGIRIAFSGDAEAIDIRVRTGDPLALATPAEHGEFTVYVGGERCGATRVEAGVDATVRIELPRREPDARVEIHVPERYEPAILGIEPIGGGADPVVPSKRWVAYGDSITQGWTTSDPGGAWTACAARATGFDLLNLGFAGAARGELPLAAHLAETRADVISLAWGTNCWAQVEMDASYIAELMRLFLTMVRKGHPETPLLVLSPVIRPAAEETRNGSGATLADLRQSIEVAVADFQQTHRDEHLHLLPGGMLITRDQLDSDGIHPNDDGHAALGAAVAERLQSITD
jgi:lysophospholipase L1-like esterase